MMILIRPAVIADAAGIANARIEAWRGAYSGIVPGTFLASLDIEKEIPRVQQYLRGLADGQYEFVAEVDGKVVGFCTGGPDRDQDPEYPGELYAIYLLPAHQRQGIGRMLVRAAVDWFGAHGYPSFLIWVLHDNCPARRFYESLGGKAVRQRTITLGGKELPEVGYGVGTAGLMADT